jgi:hypothetical protein
MTQFREFPRFMEAVEEVRQIDDNHLHWEAGPQPDMYLGPIFGSQHRDKNEPNQISGEHYLAI